MVNNVVTDHPFIANQTEKLGKYFGEPCKNSRLLIANNCGTVRPKIFGLILFKISPSKLLAKSQR
jgi:hypothetical protein